MPRSSTTQTTPSFPGAMPPFTDMYQACFEAYAQTMAETFMYTTKLTRIALEATERATAANFRASNSAAENGAATAPQAATPPNFPDFAESASTMQNMLLRGAAQWQQQMLDGLNRYGGQANGAARPTTQR